MVNWKPDAQPAAALRRWIARKLYSHLEDQRQRLYDFQFASKPRVEAVEIIVSWVTTGLLLAFFAFLLKIGVAYSRGAFVIFFFLAPAGLLGVRKISKIVLKRAVAQGAIGRRDIVLIGDLSELSVLEPRDLLAFFGAGDVNRFILGKEDDPLERESSDIRVINSVANFVRERNAREILLAVPWSDSARIDFIREHIKILPVSVRLLPDIRVRSLTDYSSSARQNIMSVEILGAPLSPVEQGVKRLVDIVLASVALLVSVPVLLLTAIAIKLDGPGPVIIRQLRKGFNGKHFVMLKFRTMTVQENGAEVAQATRNDPRCHGNWKAAAGLQHRRASATYKRLEWRDVLDRAPPTRLGPRYPVRKNIERLRVPPPRQARNNRLGAVQRRTRGNAQN